MALGHGVCRPLLAILVPELINSDSWIHSVDPPQPLSARQHQPLVVPPQPMPKHDPDSGFGTALLPPVVALLTLVVLIAMPIPVSHSPSSMPNDDGAG